MLLMDEKLYTTDQVAQKMQVTEYTVRVWLRTGKLKGYKIGKDWRVSDADIIRFLERPEDKQQEDK